MIGFYSPREQPYGAFSNFASYGFLYRGVIYRTSEHFYQAWKFRAHYDYFVEIVNAKTPRQAADLGRAITYALPADWETRKIVVMKRALYEKFTQNHTLYSLLLGTGDEMLVETSARDAYWGWGRNRNGQNMLGVLLMRLRAYLREEQNNAESVSENAAG